MKYYLKISPEKRIPPEEFQAICMFIFHIFNWLISRITDDMFAFINEQKEPDGFTRLPTRVALRSKRF